MVKYHVLVLISVNKWNPNLFFCSFSILYNMGTHARQKESSITKIMNPNANFMYKYWRVGFGKSWLTQEHDLISFIVRWFSKYCNFCEFSPRFFYSDRKND